jgi:uncharacterized protein (DUF2141 family)
MHKGFLTLLILTGAYLAILFSGTGCASIVPPSGGPRDSLPPMLVHADPPGETKHFKDKKITFTFNEYVDLDDPYKNLVISPVPRIFPEVHRKLKTLTITLKDTLIPNTTYVFNFAKSVKDITEGNRIKDLLYIVTTGNYFDSLQLSGYVVTAKTGKPDSTLTVMLHSNLDDSAVVKEKPKYIARLDSSGIFLFRHLAPGTYRLYALKDEGGSYLYTSPQQVFAFADSAVKVSGEPPKPIKLLAYSTEEEKTPPIPEPDKKEKRLKVKSNLQGKEMDLLEPLMLTFDSPLKNFDTSKIVLANDSTYTKIAGYSIRLDSTRMKATLNLRWNEKHRYALLLQKDFASDSLNRELLKPDTLRFTTKAMADYGQVKINFLNLGPAKNPVLLLVQGGVIKNSFPLKTNIFELQLYPPGEYDMQILYDENGNGKWDPGEFFKAHRQPEIIKPLERKLTVKPNWMTEFEVKEIK